MVRARGSDLLLCLALVVALGIFLGVVNHHYRIDRWLAWRYLWVSFLSLTWGLSCLSCGCFLLGRLGIRLQSPALEVVLGFPLGVFAFQIAIFLLGLAGLLHTVVFVVLPVLFLYAGLRRLLALWPALKAISPPRTFPELAFVLFGFGGVALIYFQILSPEVFHWDARWYHLPIAQQYALQGAIRPYPEGWWLDGQPHSASLIFTWAFLLPTGVLFDRLELCAHLEFLIFLATIASIPTLVRQLAPEISARGAWAGVFLFPGIFLYDSNLCGGADHIAALWCIPVVLTLLRLWDQWEPREGLLFGTFVAAGLASKFSAWSMLVFPLMAFGGRAVWLLARGPGGDMRRRVLSTFGITAAAMLVLSGQHWLRNWIWYGDPVYPILHEHLHVSPWSPEASASYRLFKSFTFPPLPGWQGLWEGCLTAFTFSFKPNDWPVFHGNVPVFGSLFTLSLLALPFVRARPRLWLTFFGAMVAIVAWYYTSHQDRYLQAWLPAMVACTMTVLGLIWQRRSRAVRALVVALVGVQIVWGGDVPFFPTHNLVNDAPIRVVSNLLASGFLRKPDRLRLFGDEGLVSERLPPDANLLLHETNMQIGFGVRTVTDQWQGRLSYAVLASPAQIYRELNDMEVTHLLWEDRMSGWNSHGSDLAFLNFALNFATDRAVAGKLTFARFPTTPPPANGFNDRVAVLSCGSPYAAGLYRLQKLVIPDPGAPWASPEAPITDAGAAIRDSGFMIVDPNCHPALPPDVSTAFHPPVALVRGPLQLYVRRR